MQRLKLDMNAIRQTLREWKGPRKEPVWKILPWKAFDDYDDSPKRLGRPRKKGRASKKTLRFRMHWRKASCRYYKKNQESILLKAASKYRTHTKELYKWVYGL